MSVNLFRQSILHLMFRPAIVIVGSDVPFDTFSPMFCVMFALYVATLGLVDLEITHRIVTSCLRNTLHVCIIDILKYIRPNDNAIFSYSTE